MKKLSRLELRYLIKEQLKSDDLKKLAQIRPNYLLDLPVQKYTDEPVVDDYGDPVYKKDEYGDETYDFEYERIPMADEIRRSRIADMHAGGIDPEHVKKIATLMQDDPFDPQAEMIARSIADDDFRFSTAKAGPKLDAIASSKFKLEDAYREIRNSDELMTYKLELARRMYHDGSMDYEDNFYEASNAMSDFEEMVAKKYGLTEEEIEKLDDMLEVDKESY